MKNFIINLVAETYIIIVGTFLEILMILIFVGFLEVVPNYLELEEKYGDDKWEFVKEIAPALFDYGIGKGLFIIIFLPIIVYILFWTICGIKLTLIIQFVLTATENFWGKYFGIE